MTQRKCLIDGCENPIPKERGNAAKHCNDHRYCLLEGCGRPMHMRGYCRMHGGRIGRTGSPGDVAPSKLPSGGVRRELEDAIATDTDFCIFAKSRAKFKTDGRQMDLSRGVWFIANGDPRDRSVLHTCGNGHLRCINLKHLYLGDDRQNARDRDYRDGRNGSSKFSLNDIREIRRRCEAGETDNSIAMDYGVWATTIYRIRTRQVWKDA